VFYLHFPRNPAVGTKTMVSAADALRQRAEWSARGFQVDVRNENGVVVADSELQHIRRRNK
jgi:hypothetical protein